MSKYNDSIKGNNAVNQFNGDHSTLHNNVEGNQENNGVKNVTYNTDINIIMAHNDIQKNSLKNMREGLSRYVDRKGPLFDMEAIFIKDLKTKYTVKSGPAKGKKVEAYTVLNVCHKGKLLADHIQLEIEGMARYNKKKWPKDEDLFTNRIRFTGVVTSYTGENGKKKYGIDLTKQPEFLDDWGESGLIDTEDEIAIYNDKPEYLSHRISRIIRYGYAYSLLSYIIDDLNDFTSNEEYCGYRIASENFVINYIMSLLFLRSKQQEYLAKGDIDELIKDLNPDEISMLVKALGVPLAYLKSKSQVSLYELLRVTTLNIIYMFGVRQTRNNEPYNNIDFVDWVEVEYNKINKDIISSLYNQCVELMIKDYQYNDQELQEGIAHKYPTADILNDALYQIECKIKEDDNK